MESPDSFYKNNTLKIQRNPTAFEAPPTCIHKTGSSGRRCMDFVSARSMPQEKMVGEDMELNLNYLVKTPY
jgi:hypothetical protein